jgi:hypothetical protein
MMIEPIIKLKTKGKKEDTPGIPEETYNNIIRSVYDIMIDYSRIQKTIIDKSHPLAVGNVIFWFETDDEVQKSYLKYDRNVVSWNQDSILSDIDLHLHSLYYNPPKQ